MAETETPLAGLACADKTHEIIGAAIEVHKELGPGLLESVYEACMARELADRGIPFQRQLTVPVMYKGKPVEEAAPLRLDFLIYDEIVVELKAVEKTIPIHEVQLVTYLRLIKKRIGLLINFNVPVLKSGVTRRVL